MRSYDDEFITDLQRGVHPRELHEIDTSSGIPTPRPVDILVADLRPASFPKNVWHRGVVEDVEEKQRPAFCGPCRKLSDENFDCRMSKDASYVTWKYAMCQIENVDHQAPTASIVVRSEGYPSQRHVMNLNSTVMNLKAHVERVFQNWGVEPRAYILLAGHPPVPVQRDDVTIQAAGLGNSVIILRWGT